MGLSVKLKIGESQKVPSLVDCLQNFKIGYVSAGSEFSACLTEDGSVFTWGWGEDGVLGLGNQQSFDYP